MAKDRLVVTELRGGHGYCVGWYLAEEQEMGLLLGEAWRKNRRTKDRAVVSDDELDTWAAEHALASLEHERRGEGCFEFESRAQAAAALKLARAAIKAARAEVPLEEWEKKALAAGWKPPRGWAKKPKRGRGRANK